MIKSLVSPREVVFRFPFQLEVDWAFQGRSAVKSELYMRADPKTHRPVSSGRDLLTVYLTCRLNRAHKMYQPFKKKSTKNDNSRTVYMWPFFSSSHTHIYTRTHPLA